MYAYVCYYALCEWLGPQGPQSLGTSGRRRELTGAALEIRMRQFKRQVSSLPCVQAGLPELGSGDLSGSAQFQGYWAPGKPR